MIKDFFEISGLSTPVKIFIFLFLVVILLTGIIVWIIYSLEYSHQRAAFLGMEKTRVDLMEKNISDIFGQVTSDLQMVGGHYDLLAYLDGGDKTHLANLAQELLQMSQSKGTYNQIRFIDESGDEVIRIEYNDGSPTIVPLDKLQNQADRYYFENSIKLQKGQIYVSPFDLNVERGKIEAPFKPTIRFTMPIFDFSGKKRGIIILNYLGSNLFSELGKYDVGQNQVSLVLLNKEGYWLKADNASDEWGFMLDGGSAKNFALRYPEIWKEIISKNEGSVEAPGGIYTYKNIRPLKSSQVSSTWVASGGVGTKLINAGEYEWRLVLFTPHNILTNTPLSFLRDLAAIIFLFLIVIGFGTWFLAEMIARRVQAEKNADNLNNLLRLINKIIRHDVLGKLSTTRFSLEAYRDFKDEKLLRIAHESTLGGINIVNQTEELESLVVVDASLRKFSIANEAEKSIKGYDIPITIKGDAWVNADQALGSVFNNLIRNAIRHGQTSKIDIEIEKQGGWCVIRIIDYGKGISDEIKGSLFQEGFKYGPTGGTGLGLYIVRKTIERYGGSVYVKDNKPTGAIFVINLPLAR